jgi:hypothetical protein
VTDDPPTPRTTLRARYVRVLVFYRHQRDANPQALVRGSHEVSVGPALTAPEPPMDQRHVAGIEGQPAAVVTRCGSCAG